MLAVSTLSSPIGDETAADGFSDGFSGGDLLDDIDFSDIFNGFDDGDMLPGLELDPDEILAQFSIGGEDPGAAAVQGSSVGDDQRDLFPEAQTREEDKCSSHGDEEAEKGGPHKSPTASSSSSEADRRRKPSAMPAKGSHGKRKVKVDWTPELHRRFVQAVEQLGVDKAVPSRILELMGIDCLTRHNIASHLQKYRSNRKHVLAREAEEASWSQKRLMYAAGGAAKRDITLQHPWLAPTMGFPPHPIPTFRPLHVWGHPSVEQPLVHVWPKHLVRPPPPPWVVPQLPLPPLPPPDPSFWHTHFPRGPRDGWVPNVVTQGTPCYPQPMPAARFPAPPVQGVPPHPLYKPPVGNHSSSQPPQLLLDTHQSKESVDAAIGDVLAKPWLPLPLGLKPPSLESVLVELQRQGVSKIPPACG